MRLLAAFALALPYSSRAESCAELGLTPEKFSELLGKTTQRVPEIRKARQIASEAGAVLVSYGGTSREIITYVCAKIRSLGGVEAYHEWIDAPDREVRLLDWHRINSDLDFMILATGSSNDPDRMGALRAAAREITETFPGNIFYQKLDVNVADDFFARFPVAQEHFEATSNIPISDQGIERIPMLKARQGERTIDMTEWGVRQYLTGQFDFALNSMPRPNDDPFGDFRQALRWIRYASEEPDMALPAPSRAAIQELLTRVLSEHREEVKSYLSGSGDQAKKIQKALEKLQLYSRDSNRTRALLREFAIDRLAEDAGVLHERILDPLPRIEPKKRAKLISGKSRLGKPLTLKHRTSLTASQNISNGAIWQSNNQSKIGGKTTKAAYGNGFYAAEGAGALGYGDIYVQFTLSADAVEGVDYSRNGSYYVIHNRDMISKIEPITHGSLFKNTLENVKSSKLMKSISDPEIASLYRTLGALVEPTRSAADLEAFNKILDLGATWSQENPGRINVLGDFVRAYFGREGELVSLLQRNPTAAKQLLDRMSRLPSLLENWDAVVAIVRAMLLVPNELIDRHPEVNVWVTKSLAQLRDLPILYVLPLLNDPKTRDALEAKDRDFVRTTLMKHIEDSGNQVFTRRPKRYNWDLSRSLDVAVLKEASTLSSTRKSGTNGARGTNGRRRRLSAPEGAQPLSRNLDRIFDRLLEQDPTAVAQHFPERRIKVASFHLDGPPFVEFWAIVFRDQRQREIKPLSEAVMRLRNRTTKDRLGDSRKIQTYFHPENTDLFLGLIESGDETQKLALHYLSQGDSKAKQALAALIQKVRTNADEYPETSAWLKEQLRANGRPDRSASCSQVIDLVRTIIE